MALKPPLHMEVFEVWYFSRTGSMEELAKELEEKGIGRVSDRTLRDWRKRHDWVKHAQERDAAIQAKTDERAVESIADMNTRHTKGAIAFQDKCKQGMFEKRKKNFNTITDAVKGYQIAVSVERVARGEASVIAEQREIETMGDIQVMLDKVSAEERAKIAEGLKDRAKATIIAEVKKDGSEGDKTRTTGKDTGASEEH